MIILTEESNITLTGMLDAFTNDLRQQIQGAPDGISVDGPELIHSILLLQQEFFRTIRCKAPTFIPFEKSAAEQQLVEEFLAIEYKDEREEDGHFIYLDEIVERFQRARTRELPGFDFSFLVQKTFLEGLVQDWHAPSITFCKAVHSMMVKHVRELIQKHFGTYEQGILEARVRAILDQHVNECFDRAAERIKWLQQLEDIPFTLNTHDLISYKNDYLTLYKGAQRILIESEQAEDLTTKSLPPDIMERALDIMADIRAYYQVAYRRFTDNVWLAVHFELVHGVEKNILSVLSLCGVNLENDHRVGTAGAGAGEM